MLPSALLLHMLLFTPRNEHGLAFALHARFGRYCRSVRSVPCSIFACSRFVVSVAAFAEGRIRPPAAQVLCRRGRAHAQRCWRLQLRRSRVYLEVSPARRVVLGVARYTSPAVSSAPTSIQPHRIAAVVFARRRAQGEVAGLLRQIKGARRHGC